MMSELSKYLNEQMGVFLNVKQQKYSQLKTQKIGFSAKTFLYNVMFYSIFKKLVKANMPMLRNTVT